MEKYSIQKFIFRLLISLALAGTALAPSPAHAAAVSIACPSGGGTYQVDTGAVTGTSGSCRGDLTLDSSVTTINNYAFSDAQLTSLTIPATVTTITGSPFANYGNRMVVSVNVAAANPNYSSIDGVLFNKAATELIVYPASKPGASYTIPSTVTSIRIYGFSGNKFLTSLDIPDTVTTMSGQVFYNSESLVTINIGTGLTSLGEQSFSYIQTLTAINVNAANTYLASVDGVLYDKAISTLWAYPIGKTATSYTSPNTVTSTKYTVFGGARKLLTVDLTSITSLTGQEFMDSTSVREVTFGNSLTELKSQVFQSASGLKRVYLGTGLTNIVSGAFWGNTRFSCVIYTGSNSTIQNYAYPNSVVPVTSSSSCLADPAFTLSKSSIEATKGNAFNGYTITSTGGAISSYSISPPISNTPGLTFSTSTGLISGTPTSDVRSITYTISGRNAADTATQTVTISPPPPPTPMPIPFLKSLSAPQMHLKDGKYVCSAGAYQFGYTLSGEVQKDTVSIVTPSSYTYTLFGSGDSQSDTPMTITAKTNSWSIAKPISGSVVFCSISVTLNGLTVTEKSTDNNSGVFAAQQSQRVALKTASVNYSAALRVNSKNYQKALVENRAAWQKGVQKNRAAYDAELLRISSLGPSKSSATLTKAAWDNYLAAQAKNSADYAASKPAAFAAKTAANKAALDAQNAAITKANVAYGTYIESIGYGVYTP